MIMHSNFYSEESLYINSEDSIYECIDKNSSDALAIVESNKVVYCNDAFVSVIGLETSSGQIDIPLVDLLGPTSVEKLTHNFHEFERFNRATSMTICRPTKNAIIRDELACSLVRWLWNSHFTVLIARKKETVRLPDEGLLKDRDMHDILAEAVPAGVILSDRNGKVVYINERTTQITGYDLQDLSCGIWLLRPHDVDVMSAYKAIIDKGIVGSNEEARFVTKDGNQKWVSVSWQPVKDDDGLVQAVYTIFSDITDEKAAESAIKQFEDRLRPLIEESDDILYQLDINGNIQYISVAVRRLGYTPQELVGKHFTSLIPHESRFKLYRQIVTSFTKGEHVTFEIPVKTADDDNLWLEVSADFVVDSSSHTLIQGIARDISERKAYQNTILQQRDFAKELASASDLEEAAGLSIDSVMKLTNTDSSAIYLVNEESGNLDLFSHYGVPELILKSSRSYPPDDEHSVIVRNGVPVFYTYETTPIKGDLAYYGPLKAIGCVPFAYEGSYIGCINIGSRDLEAISARSKQSLEYAASLIGNTIGRLLAQKRLRSSQDTLQKAMNDLEAAYKLQQEFLNNVTHEVRTPLTSVQGYAKMMLEGVAGEINNDQKKMLAKIIESSEGLMGIVSGVLEVARLKSGIVRMNPQACKPYGILARIVSLIKVQAEEKGIEINLHAQNDGAMGMYDEEKLSIILTNIISNAVKFTSVGTVEIFFSAQMTGFEIIVADSGTGIRRSEIYSVFDEFHQSTDPTEKKPSGFGIGLSIVSNMVDVIGAELVLSSAPGIGTAFTLHVPALISIGD